MNCLGTFEREIRITEIQSLVDTDTSNIKIVNVVVMLCSFDVFSFYT